MDKQANPAKIEDSSRSADIRRLGTKVVIRYPGGKQRFLPQLLSHLPKPICIEGRFVEPFFGGGAVFFALQVKPAILSDKNPELVDLYKGIRHSPSEVWRMFSAYPADKKSYYAVRGADTRAWSTSRKAARTLYLNRTCFKGMWRQNSSGMFNIGYGGQSRRWAITEEDLRDAAKALRGATILCADFEGVIEGTKGKDFLFVDPPYHPGRRESRVEHYMFCQFTFESHKRLAATLHAASRRGVQWALTTSAHPDIVALFQRYRLVPFKAGVGESPGFISRQAGEVLVLNY
jgi:DNA adenine methylase